ncbi:hypothetical protein KIPB_013457 [Kipferlia bialata]|uniref:Uncharacterized protein n=1 Tax=Kipferlia bialata TaxID=797122 RepID=A0A9K3DAZ4_9EUKA|nr:hypothetical protein KIPB_013457 [Kipferlia bialata]|eukprot:g13457.t1
MLCGTISSSVRYTSSLSSRYTVDPTSLALTDVVQLVPPLAERGDTHSLVYPVLTSDYNQTVLVTTPVLVETHQPSPLEVRLFYPDSGEMRLLQNQNHTQWPQGRFGHSVVVVGETLVVVGGFITTRDTIRRYHVLREMWCVDLYSLDSTVPWICVPIEATFADIFCSVRTGCNIRDSVARFFGQHYLSVSLTGSTSITRGVYDDPLSSKVMAWNVAVSVGPFMCLFGSPEEDGTVCVYMYDIVSGDFTQYMPLPFPDEVTSACMLNPTTMLVVHRERTLVVELDPELFERFTDGLNQ